VAIDRGGLLNSHIPPGRLDELAPLSGEAVELLRHRLEAGGLTGRGYHRIRRVARTIADLEGEPGTVGAEHVAMALGLRVRLGIGRRDTAA
jgi:magnesium chelatase family protein